jgi:hypothetical protein
MATESNLRPDAIATEDRAEPKRVWETPRVIAAEAYLTEGTAGGGFDSGSAAS